MKREQLGKIVIWGGVAGVAGYIGWRVWNAYEAERKTDEVAENDRMLEEFDYRMQAHKENGTHKPKPKRRSKAATTTDH